MGNEQTNDSAPTGTRLIWRFGDVTLDEGSRELSRGGERIDIEPKPVELLMFLLRRVNEAVTREEILAALWPGRMLTDGAVTNCVAKLREAIGDSNRMLVRTVPRCGYRLVAEVECEAVELRQAVTEGIGLQAGAEVPLRPAWQLSERLSGIGLIETWLVQREDGDERRVLKFAADTAGLAVFKHELALARALSESLSGPVDFAALLDWNFEQPPYFLEFAHYARGNLAQWCEQQGGLEVVPMKTRIEIAARGAAAVEAAHSAGVYHGDLKPTNVLIDGDRDGVPMVRLCDFAAGHMIEPPPLPESECGDSAGPDAALKPGLYLAPEVLAGQQVTASADIYALGVLLYQLLAGDLNRPLAQGWEGDIPDPLLREDIAFAVAGDPSQRLADAGRLALRLRSLVPRRAERELRENQVAEAEALQRRRLRSHGRRDMLVTLLVVALFAGLGSSALLMRALAAEELAQAQAQAVETVTELVAGDSARQADPLQPRPQRSAYGEMLDRTAQALEQRLPGHPLVRAQLRQAIGVAYGLRGDVDRAEVLLRKVARTFADELGPASLQAQRARIALRDAYRDAGRAERMGELARRVLAAEEAAGRPNPEIWYDAAGSRSVADCVEAHGAVWRADCSPDLFRLAGQAARELGPEHPAYLKLLWSGGTLAVAAGAGLAHAAERLAEGQSILERMPDRGPAQARGFQIYRAAALCAGGAPAQGLAVLDELTEAVSAAAYPVTSRLVRARCLAAFGQGRAASEFSGEAYELAAPRGDQPLAVLSAGEIHVQALLAAGRTAEAMAVVEHEQLRGSIQIDRIRGALEAGLSGDTGMLAAEETE